MENFKLKIFIPGILGMAAFLGIAHVVYGIMGYSAFGFLESAAFLIGILLSSHYKEPAYQGAAAMWVLYMIGVGFYFAVIA